MTVLFMIKLEKLYRITFALLWTGENRQKVSSENRHF